MYVFINTEYNYKTLAVISFVYKIAKNIWQCLMHHSITIYISCHPFKNKKKSYQITKYVLNYLAKWFGRFVWFMMFNATFNNISFISWLLVWMVEQTRVPEENHQLVASHRQTLSHNVVLSTPRHDQGSNSQF
jgi:hypothetical protein